MSTTRIMCLVLLVTALAVSWTTAFADSYPPEVDPTEVVTRDATPPAAGVDADGVQAPEQAEVRRPAPDVLSTTGGDVLALIAVAVVLLLVGGGVATLTRRRREGTSG